MYRTNDMLPLKVAEVATESHAAVLLLCALGFFVQHFEEKLATLSKQFSSMEGIVIRSLNLEIVLPRQTLLVCQELSAESADQIRHRRHDFFRGTGAVTK